MLSLSKNIAKCFFFLGGGCFFDSRCRRWSLCISVCPSVRLSVSPSQFCTVSKGQISRRFYQIVARPFFLSYPKHRGKILRGPLKGLWKQVECEQFAELLFCPTPVTELRKDVSTWVFQENWYSTQRWASEVKRRTQRCRWSTTVNGWTQYCGKDRISFRPS